MLEFGLPLSPAPSPVPSVRRLRLQSPQNTTENTNSEDIIKETFLALPPKVQSRVLKDLLKNSCREVLLEARSVLEPRLRHDPFQIFPIEISLRILAYISDPKSLASAAQVSRRWYFLLRDDSTWKQMCNEHHFRRLSAVGSYIHHWKHERGNSEAVDDTIDDSSLEENNTLNGGSVDGSRARRNSLLQLGSGTDSLLRYGFRLPNWGRRPMGYHITGEPESDPIGEAYYDPNVCITRMPDSYRSHFQQQYVQNQSWSTGGKLAGRYSLPGHQNAIVTCLAIKGDYVVTALDTSLILVFHSDGQLIRSLYGHVMGVWTLAMHGNMLVSGGCDRDVREWDLSSGHCVKIMRGHASTVRCLALVKGIALSGARDTTVRVWDLNRGISKHVLCGHSSSVRRVEFLKNNQGNVTHAVSASYDSTAIIWDIETGSMIHSLKGHTNQIYALAVSPSLIVTGSLDNTIKVWKTDTGSLLGTLQGHSALVGQLALRGSLLISGGSDGSVRVWDLDKMCCIHRIAAHDNTVSCLSLAGDRIVTGGPDCQIAVWNVRTGELVRRLAKSTVTTVWSVAAQEDRLWTVYSEGPNIVVELMSFVPPL